MGTWEGEKKGGRVPDFAFELISKAVILSIFNGGSQVAYFVVQSPSPKWAKKTKFFSRRSGCGPGRGMKLSGCMQDPKIYLHAKYQVNRTWNMEIR